MSSSHYRELMYDSRSIQGVIATFAATAVGISISQGAFFTAEFPTLRFFIEPITLLTISIFLGSSCFLSGIALSEGDYSVFSAFMSVFLLSVISCIIFYYLAILPNIPTESRAASNQSASIVLTIFISWFGINLFVSIARNKFLRMAKKL